MKIAFAKERHQRGASLFVVMILLLVMTLLGLAVLRGTLLQERMSANLYDRSLAFQSAEAGLRAAEAAIRQAGLTGASIGYDCSKLNEICPATVPNALTGGGCAAGKYCWTAVTGNVQELTTTQPEYYIEYMGKYTSEDDLGLAASANLNQYGGGGGVPLQNFYRITARSQNPVGSDRSIVVLQSNVVVK